MTKRMYSAISRAGVGMRCFVSRREGFTFIELVVVFACVALIASLLLFAFVRLGSHRALEQEVATVRAYLEEARMHTQSSRHASSHGVFFAEDAVTLFRGTSWADADEVLKEHRFDHSVRITDIALEDGGSEVVFGRLFGEPHTTGEIEISSTREDVQRRVILYASGFIE